MIREDMLAARWWRLRPWSANPLMRGIDRVEAVAFMLLVGLILLVVPVAGVVGTVSYAQFSEQSRQQLTDGRQVQAVVLDDDPDDASVPNPLAESASSPGPALARWEVDGVEHIGRVGPEARGHTGETVRIWVDATGDYMPVPRSGTENALAALGAALAIVVLGTVTCALTLFGIHVVMNRQRFSRWDRKWQETGRLPGWPIA
ncbi:Rv1733c family protein [Rhodococcus rhodochrous]|uniref:Rv1733c family protein n=1 Tax=Rhodococcus rhodochrous TaxID=1829 RepID=UPI0032DF5F52